MHMAVRFLNRVEDLGVLEEQWAGTDARYFVIWGRRRVGKTELLNRFVSGKRAFFFEATDTTEVSQLRAFSEELAAVGSNALLAAQPVTNWQAALAAIEQFASTGARTVIVLDEFQFLVARQPALETQLNTWWRTTGSRLPLVLIIAGSEVSFFREEVLGGKMYGSANRPTADRALRLPLGGALYAQLLGRGQRPHVRRVRRDAIL